MKENDLCEFIRGAIREELTKLIPSISPVFIENFTQNEAAKYLRRSPRTLEKWRVTGDGPPFCRAGSSVLYRRADVDNWLANQTRISTSAPSQEVVR